MPLCLRYACFGYYIWDIWYIIISEIKPFADKNISVKLINHHFSSRNLWEKNVYAYFWHLRKLKSRRDSMCWEVVNFAEWSLHICSNASLNNVCHTDWNRLGLLSRRNPTDREPQGNRKNRLLRSISSQIYFELYIHDL